MTERIRLLLPTLPSTWISLFMASDPVFPKFLPTIAMQTGYVLASWSLRPGLCFMGIKFKRLSWVAVTALDICKAYTMKLVFEDGDPTIWFVVQSPRKDNAAILPPSENQWGWKKYFFFLKFADKSSYHHDWIRRVSPCVWTWVFSCVAFQRAREKSLISKEIKRKHLPLSLFEIPAMQRSIAFLLSNFRVNASWIILPKGVTCPSAGKQSPIIIFHPVHVFFGLSGDVP